MCADPHADYDFRTQEADPSPSIGTWIWDLAKHKFTASSNWKKLHGIKAEASEDLISDSLNRVHPEDRVELETQRAKLVQGVESSLRLDYRVQKQDGTWMWIEERTHVIRNEEGDVVRLVGCEIEITDRKHQAIKTEEQLHHSIEIVKSLPVAILHIEPDGCVYANDFWSELTGLPKDAALGDGWLKAIHPEDRKTVLEYRQRLSKGPPNETVLYEGSTGRHLKPDGSINWFLAKTQVKYGPDGKRVSSTVSILDINERIRLEQQQERLTAILEATSDYVGMASPQRQIIWHNRRLAELRPDLSNPKDGSDFAVAHPEWSQKILAEVALPAAINEGSWTGEMAIYDMAGNEIPVSQVLIAHTRESGQVEAFSTIMRDIREQKRVEQALRNSEQKVSALLEALPVGVFRSTEPAKLSYVNATFCQLASCPAEAALGQRWLELLHPADAEELSARIQAFQADRDLQKLDPFTFRTSLPDGSFKWLQTQAVKELDEDGNVVGVIGIWIDVSELKATEQALSESERMFSSLAASAPVAIFRMSTLEECSYVNQRWSELTKRPTESALGKGWMNYVHPEDLASLQEICKAFAEDPAHKVADPYEVRHVLPDGSTSWVQCTLAKEFDEQGNVTGYVGTLTDIDRIKQAEEDFRQFNRRFHKVLEFSSIGVWQRSFEDDKLTWDDQMFKIYGVSQAAFSGQLSDWRARLHPDDFDRIAYDEEQNSSPSTRSRAATYRIVRPTGEVRHIYSNAYIESDDQGDPVRAIGINMDITDRREAELALLESERKLQRITENIPGMIYRYLFRADGTHQLIYASSKCREMFEVEPEEAMNNADRLFDHIHPDDLLPLKDAVRDCSENLVPFKQEFRVILPRQGLRWRLGIGHPTKNDRGDTIWDGVTLDITDQRAAQVALKHANEQLAKATSMKDQFLAKMSHELRNPLSAMLSMTEVLQESILGTITDKQREGLQTIQQSGLHLLQLINEILDLAKFESGHLELEISSVNILDLCESSLQIVNQQAEKKGIQLQFNVHWNLPDLQADEKRLRQILINLLSNAIKFTPQGGEVSLGVQRTGPTESEPEGLLLLTVMDTGIGIRESEFDALFQPFVQVDNSLSGNQSGVGLGLALVKQFVELHSGTVSIDSELNVGSCFTVQLPYRLAPPSEGPTTSVSSNLNPSQTSNQVVTNPPQPPNAKVLLVEDNEAVASSVVAYLTSCHFEVLLASDGLAALKIAQAAQPDAILMDIQIPKLDGLEAIRRIRQIPQLSETKIIVLTGRTLPRDVELCMEAGADRFLTKPTGVQDLAQEIRQLLNPTDDQQP